VVVLWWLGAESWLLDGRFFGGYFFPLLLDFFLGWLWKSKGNRFVASPFGLRSCLRQSGGRCAAGLDAGLKPRST
jgi:hypothetical protein